MPMHIQIILTAKYPLCVLCVCEWKRTKEAYFIFMLCMEVTLHQQQFHRYGSIQCKSAHSVGFGYYTNSLGDFENKERERRIKTIVEVEDVVKRAHTHIQQTHAEFQKERERKKNSSLFNCIEL